MLNSDQVKQLRALLRLLQEDIHGTAVAKGWWDQPREDGTLLFLVVSELAEAGEWLRMGNPPDSKIPRYTGVEAELADVIIRILDLAGGRGWDVVGAMLAKVTYNKSREYRHGGKAF